MSAARLRTVVELELAQRFRSVAWYVLLGVFAAVMLGVTLLSAMLGLAMMGGNGLVYSVVVYFVLLLAVLVAPAVSGNAINGDRDAATLAPVQVTLATTGEILFGKVIAAWLTGLGFLVVAIPFLLLAMALGVVSGVTLFASLVVLIVEIGVFAAIGVALSGLIARPLFSVATAYLTVAAFVIGTLIVFTLVGSVIRTPTTSVARYADSVDGEVVCTEWTTSISETPRFDTVWWVLAANPFVVLADAVPVSSETGGTDLFGVIQTGVRLAQLPPETETRYDGCSQLTDDSPTQAERLAGTVPSWWVGLGVQLLLVAGLLWGAYARLRTPARKLPPGTRVA